MQLRTRLKHTYASLPHALAPPSFLHVKVIFFTDAYYYGGKRRDCLEHVLPILAGISAARLAALQKGSSGNGNKAATTAPPRAVVTPYWGSEDVSSALRVADAWLKCAAGAGG